ncbi:MAG: ATP-binding protein [Syntrophothermus sp.]|uniref:ATP-binding protein n=1 Tax=Syntrophothermus sp. TaxID=2736299 RepID=UPI00257FEB6A|nr:ATP-binding protein [Syntrophothermus sp.]NSW82126.1 ATP-binding protein [Syntrophothermus sp.]
MTNSYPTLQRLVVYRNLLQDTVVDKTLHLISSLQGLENQSRSELESLYYSIVQLVIQKASEFALAVDPWSNYILNLIVQDENVFSLGCENKALEAGSPLWDLARHDIGILKGLYNLDWSGLAREVGFESSWWNHCWQPRLDSYPFHKHRVSKMTILHQLFSGESDPLIILEALAGFYRTVGCGQMGKYPGFRWDQGLRGIRNPDPIELDELVGIEEQKKLLLMNTEIFLRGNKANNVLLYGEKGTGKSSSVKALLTRYAPDGLRMIELGKDHVGYLADITDIARNRGFRFIVFIDDLSFEEFEVEYKHVKAAIEGSLEDTPGNLLLYVTSNRRHLVKETWRDRQSIDEEIHVSESHQEKLSLADRFGITIRYQAPSQEQYLRIVEHLARRNGLSLPSEELRRRAIQWEMRYHGRSGRTAHQFVTYLLGQRHLDDPQTDERQEKNIGVRAQTRIETSHI